MASGHAVTPKVPSDMDCRENRLVAAAAVVGFGLYRPQSSCSTSRVMWRQNINILFKPPLSKADNARSHERDS